MLKQFSSVVLALVCLFNFQIVVAVEAKVPAKSAKTVKEAPSIKMMRDAQILVKVGKYADAFALMLPYEFEKSGDITYDYLLGISAVNAGKPDRATLALERVEAVSPQYGDVRMWLGIAYFQSGDSARSKTAFKGLLTQPKLSQQSKSTADQFLAAIKQQDDAKALEERKAHQPYLVGAVEFGLGNDSNITTNPISDYPFAYLTSVGVNYTQTPPSGISARFGQVNGNIEGRVPFGGAGTYGYAVIDSSNRLFTSHHYMDMSTNLFKVGVNLLVGRHTYRIDVSKKDYRQLGSNGSMGYTSDNSQNSVTADARFTLGEHDFLGGNLQYNTPRFADSKLAAQDTNQIIVGANYTHVFPLYGSPMVYLALNHTRDKALREQTVTVYDNNVAQFTQATDVSRNTNTLIAYTQYTVVESTDVSAMLMVSSRVDTWEYARSTSLNLPLGKDQMKVAMFGVAWRPMKNWTVKPQLMRIQNESNIPLYSFQKTEASVMVKREFK
jgi:hypothetical protein